MSPMKQSLGGFRAALLAGWIALSAAGLLYARAKGIPFWIAAPVLAAFLIEYPFYLVPGFAEVRARFERHLPLFLVASFLAPYWIYAMGTGEFRWWSFIRLAALAVAFSLWYKVLPAAPWADGAFLILTAAVVLRGYLDPIYPSPLSGLHLEILGYLALRRLCAMVMLVERRVPGIGYGFVPSWTEWKIGARYFVYFLIVGIPLAWATRLVRLGPGMPVWKIAGIFAGMLWVVALPEEFFFRGLLQQWVTQWTGRPALALVIASLFFGAVHLGFRGFPNWKFALAAAVAGWFYGRAYQRTQNIRAGMVAHALVVTLWRAWFV